MDGKSSRSSTSSGPPSAAGSDNGSGSSGSDDVPGNDASSAAPPPLLHRLANRLLSSVLGGGGSEEDDRLFLGPSPNHRRRCPPSPPPMEIPNPVDARWLEGGALPRELLLMTLGFLPLPALGAFASTCKAHWALLVAGEAGQEEGKQERLLEADASSLYRALLQREVGAELPLEDYGPDELDWRACLRRWTRGDCRWRPLPLHEGSEEPPPRYLHRVAGAPRSRVALCAGGTVGPHPQFGTLVCRDDDLWRFRIRGRRGESIECRPLAWPRGPSSSPSPTERCAASLTLLPPRPSGSQGGGGRRRAYLFGGLSGVDSAFLDDLWAWEEGEEGEGGGEGGRWLQPLEEEEEEEEEEEGDEEGDGERPAPRARQGHSVVAYGGKLVLFGGSAPGVAFADLWVFDPATRSWTLLPPRMPLDHDSDDEDDEEDDDDEEEEEGGGGGAGGAHPRWLPRGRGGHSAAVVGGRWMYVFGGNTLARSFGDCWRVDLEASLREGLAVWEAVPPAADSPSPPPAARIGHISFAVGPRLYIVGGRDFISGTFHPGPGHVLDTRTRRWSVLRSPAPSALADDGTGPRRDHWSRTGGACIPHPAGAVVYGGLLAGNAGLAQGFWLLDVVGLMEG